VCGARGISWYNPVVRIGRLLLAIAVATGVVLSAPFIRDIRDFIKTTFPGYYVTFVGAAIALVIAAGVLAAFARIRDRRALRYGAIAAALALGTAYALWNAQGIVEVDTVERFHFVEYGLVALLFYRAFQPAQDVSTFVLPIVAGLIAGTGEEWLQWFIPGRIGDMRDVFLNGVAILCGLLFSVGIDPPDRFSWSLTPASRRRVGLTAAAAVLVFAAFVHNVHLGTEIDDPEAGRFRSRYDGETLLALARDRGESWKANPPLAIPRSRSREDQYFSEGLLHVQTRNKRWAAGDFPASWFENLILEKYYHPLLDTASYISKAPLRWPAEQRLDGERRYRAAGAPPPSTFVSMADAGEGRHFIRLWSRPTFWAIAMALVAALIVFALRPPRAPVVST
jgi:hypothetical protein